MFTKTVQTGPTITARAYRKQTDWGEVCGAVIGGFILLCLLASL